LVKDKLGWALGQTDDLDKVRGIMLKPICGEITEREPHDGYLVFQGGMPEIEEFMKKVRQYSLLLPTVRPRTVRERPSLQTPRETQPRPRLVD
jgi:hypothetical protein